MLKTTMTLEEKIGQLFVMGFRGGDVSPGSTVHHDIAELGVGGVILFDKDMVYHRPVNNIESPEQLNELTKQLQSYSDLPLFISIDQEGGLINRLKPEYGFPETRSHGELGKLNDPKETETEGAHIAKILRGMGINLNFAPVLDIAKNPETSVIGKRERSFGADDASVSLHSEAYVRGHESENILSCCKHFPGHGSAVGDTHFGFVDVTDTWEENEVAPYKNLIEKDLCRMIMTAHIFNKRFDDKLPSTLSEKAIQGFLRTELGYDGVVISDDMQMQAISDHYSLKESLRLGILAGLDLFCFGNNLLQEQIKASEAINAVLELVEEGEISEERIDVSVNRILKLKEVIA
tara:strand:+ start:1424 stop:2470 length:1047 start_codon:yes stop_codon:yes gene_type:complete